MNLKKLLGMKNSEEKLSEYFALYREMDEIRKESQLLAESFSINKSQLEDLSKGDDPEIMKSTTTRFTAFLSQHTKDVVTLCNRQSRIEKSMQNIEKCEEIKEAIQDYKQIREIKEKAHQGLISKSIYYDLLKSKEGVVKYADVLVFREGKLLILQRAEDGMFSDQWCVPGGHVDAGEDFKKAASRELYEETGLFISEGELSEVAVYKDKDCEIHYFMGHLDEKISPMVVVDAQEEIGSAWIDPLKDLDKYKFIFDMKSNIERILGISRESSFPNILKAFQEGSLSEKVFADFCKGHEDEIRRENNKSNFSHKERKDLSEKGEAMSDGKFPIRNAQDLKDAIRLSGSSTTPASKVKTWIKKRAKELDLEKELPESWEEKEIEKAADTETAQVLAKESLDGEIKNVTTPQKDSFEKSREPKVMTIEYIDGEDSLKKIIEAIKKIGNEGHSFTIVLDPDLSEKDGGNQKFGWDGDGGCQIMDIKIGKADIEKSETFDVNIGFNDMDQAEMFKSLVEDWGAKGKLEIASILTTGFEEDPFEKSENSMKVTFTAYLNFIEGVKTRLKNIHWAEEDSAKHINLDELAEAVSEFEDKISEASQADFGRFESGEIKGDEIKEEDPIKICELITTKTKELRKVVAEDENYNGEISWIDDFLASLKQSKYRLQMH